MCSYCGCEAEPLVTALMADHAAIAHLAYQLRQVLDAGTPDAAAPLMAALAERFEAHSCKEEAGLFAEMAATETAGAELDRLRGDHERLRRLLAWPGLAGQPARLRSVLADLEDHAQTEDNDLFPYALQVLPATSWDRINDADVAINGSG